MRPRSTNSRRNERVCPPATHFGDGGDDGRGENVDDAVSGGGGEGPDSDDGRPRPPPPRGRRTRRRNKSRSLCRLSSRLLARLVRPRCDTMLLRRDRGGDGDRIISIIPTRYRRFMIIIRPRGPSSVPRWRSRDFGGQPRLYCTGITSEHSRNTPKKFEAIYAYTYLV